MKMDVHLPVSLGTADKHQSGLTTLPPYPSVQFILFGSEESLQ